MQAAIMAKSGGAKQVICLESQPQRRTDAKRMGFVTIAPESMALMLSDATGGEPIDSLIKACPGCRLGTHQLHFSNQDIGCLTMVGCNNRNNGYECGNDN
jgi:threonine dehydrogenase-like Zn-dependent dehydrogenase